MRTSRGYQRMQTKKILIVDDEKDINKLLQSYIQKEGYTAVCAFSGKEALEQMEKEEPDLVILDVMLPDMTGVDTCLAIRRTNNAPIIFLSCKAEEVDKIIALSVGGDDYITKPFLPGELIARIKAHLRRQGGMQVGGEPVSQEKIFRCAGLVLNEQTREVFVNGIQTSLSAKEFDILALLIQNPKRIFSSEQIFEAVWKTNAIASDSRTIMVYVSTLRKKIEYNPDNPRYIVNVRSVGYKFNHHLFG